MNRYLCFTLLAGAAVSLIISVEASISATPGGCSLQNKAASMQNEQIEEQKIEVEKSEA